MTETISKRTEAVTPRGINHLVLNVRNIEESHHFWSDLLGFKQVGKLKPRADGIPSMTMQLLQRHRRRREPPRHRARRT